MKGCSSPRPFLLLPASTVNPHSVKSCSFSALPPFGPRHAGVGTRFLNKCGSACGLRTSSQGLWTASAQGPIVSVSRVCLPPPFQLPLKRLMLRGSGSWRLWRPGGCYRAIRRGFYDARVCPSYVQGTSRAKPGWKEGLRCLSQYCECLSWVEGWPRAACKPVPEWPKDRTGAPPLPHANHTVVPLARLGGFDPRSNFFRFVSR